MLVPLGVLVELDDIFQADQLFDEMKKRGYRVSKATMYRTIKLLQEAGISPWQVLESGTRNVGLHARAVLGHADAVGLVAPGYRADLVLLDGGLHLELGALDGLDDLARLLGRDALLEVDRLADGGEFEVYMVPISPRPVPVRERMLPIEQTYYKNAAKEPLEEILLASLVKEMGTRDVTRLPILDGKAARSISPAWIP